MNKFTSVSDLESSGTREGDERGGGGSHGGVGWGGGAGRYGKERGGGNRRRKRLPFGRKPFCIRESRRLSHSGKRPDPLWEGKQAHPKKPPDRGSGSPSLAKRWRPELSKPLGAGTVLGAAEPESSCFWLSAVWNDLGACGQAVRL
uniref:Uncharacterized protein n=1 Tax=Sphaerodactylus townsendi TaxID=933632 RepID=A0ACB8G738_9SAUR